MSPKNQVHPLSYLCVKYVATELIQVLADEEGRNYVAVERYLSDVTYEVVQDLLKNILSSENLDAATRFSCLQVLLRQDVKKLDTGIFPHSYYEDILKVITSRGQGLQHLNLKGVWARDHPTLLKQLLKNLNKLKSLIIPHMVDDSILEEIVSSCKCLNVLDISGECFFSVEGLKKLKSDTIRILDLGNFGKCDICEQEANNFELVAEVIGNLPNLTHLRIYSFTGSALFLLANNNTFFKTKLKYLHDTNTSKEIMDAIVKLCPELESVHLDSPELGALSKLNQLKRIYFLKLTKVKNEEILDFLETSGSRIQILKLNHSKKSAFDLSALAKLAPNLLTLECFQLKLSFRDPNCYFMQLQNVEILYCDVTDSILKCVLTNSPLLKRIVVGCVVNMTDGDIFRICAECDFAFLEELWFSNARSLTSTSVELLIGHCPNLKVIGQLNGWDLHQEEVDYLRSVIISTNTDLILLPLGLLS